MSYSSTQPWTLESLDFDRIDVQQIRHNEDLFFLLCSASFVESGSDFYTHNLVDHFGGNDILQTWLGDHWEHEELQHGLALATYVKHVWPDFDWDKGFKAFWNEYGQICTTEQLESSRGLELAARCVVETGTASLYRALNEIAEEPVLKQLTKYIQNDEVRHYKNFLHHFKRYQKVEKLSRLSILSALIRRVREIKNEDGDIALRHVFNTKYPDLIDNDSEFQLVSSRAQKLLRRHIPASMTMKMLLKPLDLHPRLQRSLEKPLVMVTERLFLH
ncbi:ferritin-like domain-containing protein [Aquirhabdus sp.]|uniref:ferritin-like domain-containing protein n=1 Tax=Aquirhabdus sp. TaxID=2824160 RepID=UPI00396C4EA5